MIAYHFISDEYALDVISSQWIKLSLFQDLNDPFELLSVDLPNEQARREARKFKEFMAKINSGKTVKLTAPAIKKAVKKTAAKKTVTKKK